MLRNQARNFRSGGTVCYASKVGRYRGQCEAGRPYKAFQRSLFEISSSTKCYGIRQETSDLEEQFATLVKSVGIEGNVKQEDLTKHFKEVFLKSLLPQNVTESGKKLPIWRNSLLR